MSWVFYAVVPYYHEGTDKVDPVPYALDVTINSASGRTSQKYLN